MIIVCSENIFLSVFYFCDGFYLIINIWEFDFWTVAALIYFYSFCLDSFVARSIICVNSYCKFFVVLKFCSINCKSRRTYIWNRDTFAFFAIFQHQWIFGSVYNSVVSNICFYGDYSVYDFFIVFFKNRSYRNFWNNRSLIVKIYLNLICSAVTVNTFNSSLNKNCKCRFSFKNRFWNIKREFSCIFVKIYSSVRRRSKKFIFCRINVCKKLDFKVVLTYSCSSRKFKFFICIKTFFAVNFYNWSGSCCA